MNALGLITAPILLGSWINYSIDRKPLDLGNSVFPSPDGTRVASFRDDSDNRSIDLVVSDRKTGHVDNTAEVLTPIFSVLWTRDSKSILTIAHIAHGSTASIFHLTKNGWKNQNLAEPDLPGANDLDTYRVVEEIAKAKATEHDFVVYYEFAVQKKNKDGDLDETIYDETDRVDPQAGTAVLLKRTQR